MCLPTNLANWFPGMAERDLADRGPQLRNCGRVYNRERARQSVNNRCNAPKLSKGYLLVSKHMFMYMCMDFYISTWSMYVSKWLCLLICTCLGLYAWAGTWILYVSMYAQVHMNIFWACVWLSFHFLNKVKPPREKSMKIGACLLTRYNYWTQWSIEHYNFINGWHICIFTSDSFWEN